MAPNSPSPNRDDQKLPPLTLSGLPTVLPQPGAQVGGLSQPHDAVESNDGLNSLSGMDTAVPKVGKFQLVRTLGSGGMGQVWLARDTVAKVDVALKILPEAFRSNPEEQKRLMRSFQAVKNLPPHPSICELRDLNHDDTLGYYLVMEYIDGKTLSSYRFDYEQKHGSFPLSELVRILHLVADALDYAHDRKLIHRDIKPTNILIKDDGQELRVIDFQLAWEIRSTASRTNSNARVDNSGTYPYMAPELWLGGDVSPQSDQYALAIMTFELLDGRLPFAANDQMSWTIIATNPNTKIRAIKGLPEYAQKAIIRALHFDPQQRFDTCRQFVEALAGQESRETENFIRWKRTPAAPTWLAKRNGAWSQQDFLQLLETLRRSDFWPMREEDIREALIELQQDRSSENTEVLLENEPSELADSAFVEAQDSENGYGKQINIPGYPPLSQELLDAEVEYHRQVQLLKQVEDGNHPVLEAGRKRVVAAQRELHELSKDHERRMPRASPGVLESIAETISKNPDTPVAQLAELLGAPPEDELFGFVQRLKRVLASKNETEKLQRQGLIDRQTFSEKLRSAITQLQTRLDELREKDLEGTCAVVFNRSANATTLFPTAIWIKELPLIRQRRYTWSDDELLIKAEAIWKRWAAQTQESVIKATALKKQFAIVAASAACCGLIGSAICSLIGAFGWATILVTVLYIPVWIVIAFGVGAFVGAIIGGITGGKEGATGCAVLLGIIVVISGLYQMIAGNSQINQENLALSYTNIHRWVDANVWQWSLIEGFFGGGVIGVIIGGFLGARESGVDIESALNRFRSNVFPM